MTEEFQIWKGIWLQCHKDCDLSVPLPRLSTHCVGRHYIKLLSGPLMTPVIWRKRKKTWCTSQKSLGVILF